MNFRVVIQSERSERQRDLTPAERRRLRVGAPGGHFLRAHFISLVVSQSQAVQM